MKKNRQGITEEDVEMTPMDEDEDKDMDDGKSDRSDVSLTELFSRQGRLLDLFLFFLYIYIYTNSEETSLFLISKFMINSY